MHRTAPRRVNGHEVRLPTYPEFVRMHLESPDSLPIPSGFKRLSSGRVGGKNLGMVFIGLGIGQGCPIAGDKTSCITIPQTWMVGTDTDEEFLRVNRIREKLADIGLWPLSEYVKTCTAPGADPERIYFDRIIPMFMDAELPPSIIGGLREVAESPGPKIVRSANDLEDGLDHMAAGMFFSMPTANNRGTEGNLQDLMHALKRVYASAFNPDAVFFMEKKRFLDGKNRMAIAIMDVFGKQTGNMFHPDVSGVVFTKSYTAWHPSMRTEDPSGRFAYGMCTKVVDMGDFAREIYLSNPTLRPEGTADEIVRVSQERFDTLDLQTGRISDHPVSDAVGFDYNTLLKICSVMPKGERGGMLTDASIINLDPERFQIVVTFEKLTKGGAQRDGFFGVIRTLSRNLEELFYGSKTGKQDRGLDLELGTILGTGEIGVWQCRPMGHRPGHKKVAFPENVPCEKTVLCSENVLGNGVVRTQHIVFVPREYLQNPGRANDVKMAIGRLDRELGNRGETYVLITPGRVGSSQPNLGVPVRYHEIINANALVEYPDSVSPEMSTATHFFNDFFKSGKKVFLAATGEGTVFNYGWLVNQPRVDTGCDLVIHIQRPEGFSIKVDGSSRKGIIYTK